MYLMEFSLKPMKMKTMKSEGNFENKKMIELDFGIKDSKDKIAEQISKLDLCENIEL
jgi:hypothetical protein